MRLYLRNEYAQTTARATILTQKLQIKLAFSRGHSLLTPGQPVLALTL